MRTMLRSGAVCLLTVMGVLGSGCGGGGNSGGGGGGSQNPVTPTVTVTPASSAITAAQSLKVVVSVSGGSGTPTGSVTLNAGSYTSSASTLSGGSASITIQPGSLAAGSRNSAGSWPGFSSRHPAR